MENEVYENTTDETIDNYAETETGSGIIGKILIGGIALATGVAGGLAIKYHGKIREKVNEVKAKKLDRKIKKVRTKLVKLESKQAPTQEAEKE